MGRHEETIHRPAPDAVVSDDLCRSPARLWGGNVVHSAPSRLRPGGRQSRDPGRGSKKFPPGATKGCLRREIAGGSEGILFPGALRRLSSTLPGQWDVDLPIYFPAGSSLATA